jgi:arsenate reductase (thioredoxin)
MIKPSTCFATATTWLGALIIIGFFAAPTLTANPVEQVLFVCERGNVKSLMAASYFNQLAAERKLPVRAISRGVAPNSTVVPPAIVDGLQAEGIDVSEYRPQALSPDDASEAQHVVTIGTELPRPTQPTKVVIERWDDVPAASTNYTAASDSLRAHVRDLVERLSNAAR